MASKSAEAAKNTTELIEASLASVEEGSKFANATSDSLNILVDGTKSIISAMAEISKKTDLQSEALDGVSLTISNISNVVQDNAGMAEQNAATSQELKEQAQRLEENIEQFKLKAMKIN